MFEPNKEIVDDPRIVAERMDLIMRVAKKYNKEIAPWFLTDVFDEFDFNEKMFFIALRNYFEEFKNLIDRRKLNQALNFYFGRNKNRFIKKLEGKDYIVNIDGKHFAFSFAPLNFKVNGKVVGDTGKVVAEIINNQAENLDELVRYISQRFCLTKDEAENLLLHLVKEGKIMPKYFGIVGGVMHE